MKKLKMNYRFALIPLVVMCSTSCYVEVPAGGGVGIDAHPTSMHPQSTSPVNSVRGYRVTKIEILKVPRYKPNGNMWDVKKSSKPGNHRPDVWASVKTSLFSGQVRVFDSSTAHNKPWKSSYTLTPKYQQRTSNRNCVVYLYDRDPSKSEKILSANVYLTPPASGKKTSKLISRNGYAFRIHTRWE